ncbi:MAG: ribosome biogenesis GTPase Der, partial [Acidobacteria bacterium]|nr:ribosome biogenesis GTPase Der [Acidobacteriota bacterium]
MNEPEIKTAPDSAGKVTSPLVAIIGRPNVGKSTLFNRLIGSRRSIVGDLPGITRDRIYGEAEWQGRRFRVVDTGGIVPDDEELIPSRIFEQARTAISEASLILWVVDIRDGVTPLDEELAGLLRTIDRPVLVVANKADTARVGQLAGEFYRFGFLEVYPVSAEHATGFGELLDAVLDLVPTTVDEAPSAPPEIRVAIIGRPNVGKSSLINRLLGEDRVIVSPIPGTTRDAVDSVFESTDDEGLPIKLRL